MAVTTPPILLQAGSHSAKAFRQANAGQLASPVQTLAAGTQITTAGGGHGVVGNGDLLVTQRGAGINRSVDVAKGYAFITGTSSLAQGVYGFANDATVNLPLAVADATNPRIDVIVAQVRDNTEDASGSDDARLFAVTGTPAASPAVPTIPAGSLVLAHVSVPANDTTIDNAQITDKRTFACSIGGVQRCLSTVRPSGASLYEGMFIYEIDTDRTWYHNGTSFILVGGPVPRCVLRPGASTSSASGINTPVNFSTEAEDTDGFHSTVSNTSRITIPAGLGGVYLFSYSISFTASGTGYRQTLMQKNGAGSYYASALLPTVASAQATILNGSAYITCAAGDYVEAIVNQTAGTLSVGTSVTVDMFAATYIGPS